MGVEGHEHRVQGRGGRLAGALVGGGDGPLADRFGVGGGHAEAVATEGFAQRRPGGAQLSGGGVDAAELFGQGKGAFGFGPVGEEPAWLPAQRVAVVPAPLLGSHSAMSRCRRSRRRAVRRHRADPAAAGSPSLWVRSPRAVVGGPGSLVPHPSTSSGSGQWHSSAPTPTARSWRPAGCRTATSACCWTHPATSMPAGCWWWRRPRCGTLRPPARRHAAVRAGDRPPRPAATGAGVRGRPDRGAARLAH
jgi:hypothetical protein